MIESKKILKAFNDKLRTLFPNTNIYGVETKEGYITPCFNTELEIRGHTSVNKSITVTDILITCDYLMTTVDTVRQMEVVDSMKLNFYKYLVVDDRVLHISDFSLEYTGEYGDVLTFYIYIKVFENHYNKVIDHPIENVDLKLKRQEDGSVFK